MDYNPGKFNYFYAWRLLALNVSLYKYWLFLPLTAFFLMILLQDFRLIFFAILSIFLIIGLNNLLYFTLIFLCFSISIFYLLNGDFVNLQFCFNLFLTLWAGLILSNSIFLPENKTVIQRFKQEYSRKNQMNFDNRKGFFSPVFYRILLFFMIIFFLFFGLNGISVFFDKIRQGT